MRYAQCIAMQRYRWIVWKHLHLGPIIFGWLITRWHTRYT